MSIEPRPIAEILAELLPKYLSNAQKPNQPECMNRPEFDDTVEPFRDLNNTATAFPTFQSRVG